MTRNLSRDWLKLLVKLMRFYAGFPVLLASVLIASGCDRSAATSTKDSGAYFGDSGESYDLAILGYNYTSRYIATFSVNGGGGGNIMVSSPTSGGSGSSCCAAYSSGAEAVSVRWQTDACVFSVPNDVTKEEGDEIHIFYKELRAPVARGFVTIPKFMEGHFYLDGKVEAAVTDSRSAPRLALSEDRRDRTKYRRCPDNKEPK
jgi:hypothetical protein